MKVLALTKVLFLSSLLIFGCQPTYEYEADDLPVVVDFNFHVKPILSDRCFQCHGPDANQREAGLRLDLAASAIDSRLESGGFAIVPGNLRKSKLFHRIVSTDPDVQMPPLESNLSLSAREIALLSRWIAQGAEYKSHWSFLPIANPAPPELETDWVKNPIDQFILTALSEQQLTPESKADKETLLRRVTLDLTGLPPTIEEIDTFLADDQPDAFESVIDHLMQTDAYAERMAMDWLDVARYADSHGYSLDGYRYMWPWRDWVIDAFKQNMPFDQFVTWQLAGDLLPEASQKQKLATAFLRNQRLNAEGGIVPEEYLVEYAVDRTATTSTAFLGLTVECARCHDHKYDPISQREFYELYAFFNNVNELGEIRGDGNDGPQVLIMSEETENRIAALELEIDQVESQMSRRAAQIHSGEIPEVLISLNEALLSRLDFESPDLQRVTDAVVSGRSFTFLGEVESAEGYTGNGLKFTPYDALEYPTDFAAFDRADPFSFSFWVRPFSSSGSMVLLMKNAGKNDSERGYEIALAENRLSVKLNSVYPSNRVEVHSQQQLEPETWTHVVVSYSGSGTAEGVSIYLNGEVEKSNVLADNLSQSIVSKTKLRPLRIGWKRMYQKELDEGYAVIDDLRVYGRMLSGIEAALLYDAQVPAERHDSAAKKNHFVAQQDVQYQRLRASWRSLMKARNSIQDTLAGVMVMDDMTVPRPTHILDRGVYDAPGEQVYPSTPESILPFDANLPRNRLGFARWLTDERHPLTARVAVNRYWQLFFGRGLVETTEDFGSQGALPSHPELLDWLASRFIEGGWDIRSMQKLILMSATYQQRSTTSADKRAADPDNVWMSRGPSHRLPAETLRDQALAASGLLVQKVGGPGVKPYQPPGLWAEKSEFTILNEYVPDKGDDRYRRGMYTFWRRTSPPPAMILFDAPTRDMCTVRRQQTTTPFQALVLLNDPQFVEAARALAERILISRPGDVVQQIELGYRLLTGMHPSGEAKQLLVDLFNEEYTAFENQPAEATALLGEDYKMRSEMHDVATLAAMVVVTNTMMSLQESVFKL